MIHQTNPSIRRYPSNRPLNLCGLLRKGIAIFQRKIAARIV